MRVNLNQPAEGLVESSGANSGKAAATPAGAAANSVLGEDQAQLSEVHAQVQALVAQAAQLPEVRQERVQALRQVVQGGNYNPAPQQIAGALLEDMLVRPAA